MQFADPRTDFAFKLIFGNEKAKGVLVSFLNAVLGLEGSHEIIDVTILNPYQAPKISELKHSILDVKCRDNRGVEFVVEMQIQYTEGFKKRIQYNVCKAYTNQITSGTDYPKLNQIIGITITDFVMFDTFDHYLSGHEFRETISNNCYLDEIRHYFIELPKFTKKEAELETTVEKWCYFLKNAGHLEVIPKKLSSDPFRKAFDLANRANMTKEEWEAYDATSVWLQDQRGLITAAHQEGRKERNLELARAMRQKSFDKNLVMELTGLSKEEIERM
ncbi:MAG: Rpn family recombination-promoting nuclease/putative transposase [bacterium]